MSRLTGRGIYYYVFILFYSTAFVYEEISMPTITSLGGDNVYFLVLVLQTP